MNKIKKHKFSLSTSRIDYVAPQPVLIETTVEIIIKTGENRLPYEVEKQIITFIESL